MLIAGLALIIFLSVMYVKRDSKEAPLILQSLDYTENPVDIPNPDRGFYRAAEFVVPVDSGTPHLPELATTISGTKVAVETHIIYMEFRPEKLFVECSS
jgi:hypothetical protein